MTIKTSTIAAAVAISACLSAAPVAADPIREPVHARVNHSDLNLASAAGRATLKLRLDRAIRRACTASVAGMRDMIDGARCRDEMLRDADIQVAALAKRQPVELAVRR